MSVSYEQEISGSTHQQCKNVLVVEDDFGLREALEDTLRLAHYSVVSAKNAEHALELLAKHKDISMIVSDINMGEMSGHDLLLQVNQYYAHIPVLLMTAYGSIKDSVGAIRNGAVDYLVKPFEPKELVTIVNRYLGTGVSQQDDAPIVVDPQSQQLLQLAKRVAQANSTVLIAGESGTGKEVLARYIHQQSSRSHQPFVAINCAAIPENMLEAMLFGYEKGAYTGAYTSAPGKFEQANGGTLLLDEISEMDIGLQAKLLRVLQEKEVERLGGRKTISLDVRVVATTNRDMLDQVREGKFREDLYYRLNVLPLIWKPLRERPADILPLANKLLAKHISKQKRKNLSFSPEAETALVNHPWPGNVRELDNVVQRALILQTGKVIYPEDLGLDLQVAYSPRATDKQLDRMAEPSNDQLNSCDSEFSDQRVINSDVLPEYIDNNGQLGDDLQKREFEIIAKTLQEEEGSRKNTAQRLGISPRTLRYKLAKMRDAGMIFDKKLPVL